MKRSKILTPDRLSFVKNVSHFSNYDTRIMKFIPPQNPEECSDYEFDKGDKNQFFFALYSSTPTDTNLFQEESEVIQLFEHPSLNKLIATGSNLNSDSPNSIVSALYKDIPYFTIASKLPTLTHTQKIIILYGIASALKYLQINNILFYNLDTNQMYLNRQNEPLIDGFGLSCFQPSFQDISYVAPELLAYIKYHKNLHNNNIKEGEQDNQNIDLTRAHIFAFGYFMIEIITEKKPVLLRRTPERYFYSYPINLSKQYHDLISNCICAKPEDRLSFDDILENLQEIVSQNDGISTDLFNLYRSKFSDVKYFTFSNLVFKYPLSCFLKPDSETIDDEFFDEFTIDGDETPRQTAENDSKTNQNPNQTQNQNQETVDESSSTNNTTDNTNTDPTQSADTNNETNTAQDDEADADSSSSKKVTMPKPGVPRIRFRQFGDQTRSARARQYRYAQFNGQNQYYPNCLDNSNPKTTSSSVPGTSRPRKSLNLASMYTRSSNDLGRNSNSNSKIPLLSFREFQMRMFPQEQVPNISFITTDNDIEILKKRKDPDSQYILGYYYETKERYEDAFELYRSAALRGHSQALYREGLLLMNGNGCKQNMKKASKLFLQSAKQRNTDAAYQFILIHGKREQDSSTNGSDQNPIQMPKEPSTTRDRKSGRNLRKNATQKPTQSARVVKKSFDSYTNNQTPPQKSNDEEKNDNDTEFNTFTLESSSNPTTTTTTTTSANSTTSNEEETEVVDIEHELKICMNYLQYSSDIGFADSMFKLAILHEQGISYKKDLHKAFSLYKRAADRGVTEACYRAATMMLEGRGTSRAFNEAAFYLQKAARKGHVEAIFKCGQLFENGLGVTKNVEKAAEFYREASSKGHTESKRYYARIIRHFKHDEKNKNVPANSNEVRYTPIVNDEKLAFKLMKEAADSGDNEALTELGEMYRDGYGTEKNLKSAFMCFKKASSSQLLREANISTSSSSSISVSSSCFSISNEASTSTSTSSSSDDSLSFDNKNNNHHNREHFVMNNNHFYNDIVNNSKSKNKQSDSYSNLFDGCGGTIYSDYVASSRSAPSFDLSQKPSARACVNIGLMYEQGMATQTDPKKAVHFFKMSADMRDPLGQFHYARAFENGVGVQVDLKSAAKYYRLSANQGFDRAQFNIARYLEFGLGVQQDKSLAIQFYKCAARQGIKAAEVALRRLKPNCL